MDCKFTPELIEKVKQAKSAEELTELSKENGVDITEGESEEYFEQPGKSGELSDDELDNVAGGRKGGDSSPHPKASYSRACENFVCRLCYSRKEPVWAVEHMCARLSKRVKDCCPMCKYHGYNEKGAIKCNISI